MANTYGNSGNRWWVGQNVGETGGNSSFSVIGLKPTTSIAEIKPSGYESLPSGNASDDAQFAAAAKANKGSKNPNTISVENVKWFNIQGPYTTQAAADAAIPNIQANDAAQGATKQEANAGNPVISPAASALNTAESWEQAIVDFLQGLTSANLWIRAAKIAIGGTILVVGLAKLTGADKKAGGLAAKAVKIAPLL